jgi:hypothetical protein
MKTQKQWMPLISVLGATLLLVFFNNCGGLSSSSSDETPNTNNSQATTTTTVPQASCSQAQLDQLDAELTTALTNATTDTPFSLRLQTEDGRNFVYNRAGSSMTTVYESASTSKWVSATIILSFIESAENQASPQPLALDSHPQDFIGATNWPIAGSDTLFAITLRQLLSFTSGLNSEPGCQNSPTADFATCVKAIATSNAGNGEIPGAKYYYSSTHLQVAGLMAIKARDLAKGVNNSTWQSLVSDFKTKTGQFPTGTFDLPSTTNPRLAGGMHWTGNEYFDFVRATYHRQILSQSVLSGQTETLQDQQFSDQVGNAVIANSPALVGIQEDWRYGFGLWLECHSPTYNCGRVAVSNSSPGAYGAYPFLNRESKFFGILARQGSLGTFRDGYAVFAQVAPIVKKWAEKQCH